MLTGQADLVGQDQTFTGKFQGDFRRRAVRLGRLGPMSENQANPDPTGTGGPGGADSPESTAQQPTVGAPGAEWSRAAQPAGQPAPPTGPPSPPPAASFDPTLGGRPSGPPPEQPSSAPPTMPPTALPVVQYGQYGQYGAHGQQYGYGGPPTPTIPTEPGQNPNPGQANWLTRG